MFLQLYRQNGGPVPPAGYNGPYGPARPFLESHPVQLAFLMDQFWYQRNPAQYPVLNTPGGINRIRAFPFYEVNQVPNYLPIGVPIPTGYFWLHNLIYAYVIENTRIYEVMEKVIFEYLHGEKLGFPRREETYLWLRAAEELFYKGSSNYLLQSIVSDIRPDIRASRRNLYYRFFSSDLNHSRGGTASYPYHKPAAANKEFVPLWEEFLAEVWVGIAYETSIAGPNLIDEPKMVDLIGRIRELLNTRRQSGNITREEFYHVAAMSWLHLTLCVDDAPIVADMGISAESPAERLRQMGERVGYPAHPKADAFFKMAEYISAILVCIEHIPQLAPQVFYNGAGILRESAEIVITQWSLAAGKDLKSLKVRPGTVGSVGTGGR